MKVFSDDPGCSRFIKEYGEYSPGEVALLSLYINDESEVIDVGANIGGLTLPFAQRAKIVHAFEPQEDVRYLLQDNMLEHDYLNVHVHPYALADQEGTMYYGPETSNWGPDSTGSVEMVKEQREGLFEAEVRTLDSFNLSPTLIKIDVEGMELPVLAGAQATIRRCQPVIWLERQPHQMDALARACHFFGYKYSQIDLPVYYPTNWNGKKENIYPGMAHLSVIMYPDHA